MRFGVEEGSGYEPVPLKAVTEVDGIVRTALERQAPNLPGLLRLFNAHLLLLPESTRYRHPGRVTICRRPGIRMWAPGFCPTDVWQWSPAT